MYIISQTFYIDPNAAPGSSAVYITSVDLYFEAVPAATNNKSGIASPGVHFSISDTSADGSPNYASTYTDSQVFVPYANITADATAATKTTVTLPTPILLPVGKSYSIQLQADDPDFVLWTATTNQVILGTSSPFPGFAGSNQGQLYDYGTSGTLTPVQSTQLKYNVSIAQFSSNNSTYELVNSNYEFLTVTGQKGSFIGGEYVFPLVSNVVGQTLAYTAGSPIVTGSGTAFLTNYASGAFLVTLANSSTYYVGQVNAVTNNTYLTLTAPVPYTNAAANYMVVPIGLVYNSVQSSNTLFLTGSTANSTVYLKTYVPTTGSLLTSCNQITAISPNTNNLFVGQPIVTSVALQTGTTIAAIVNTTCVNISTTYAGSSVTANAFNFSTPIVGVTSTANGYIAYINNLPVNIVEPELGAALPAGANLQINVVFSSTNGTAFSVNTSNFANAINNQQTIIQNYNALLLSRSAEVTQSPSFLYGSQNKSAVIKVQVVQQNVGSSALTTSPYLYAQKLDVFLSSININNDYTNETTGYGNAKSRHITTVINFDPNYAAEDLLVQTVAYLPANTQIIPFAKLYNSMDSDSFSIKEWTQMYPVNNSNTTPSSTSQSNNYVLLSWGLPNQPVSAYQANGTVATSLNQANVTGSNTNFGSEIKTNDVVKVYSALLPNVYQVAVVSSVTNSTLLTLNSKITNATMVQTGLLIDKIADSHIAFTNPQNQNIVRYYNSTLTEIDSYDTLQIKLVLLSSNTVAYPRIASLTAVGISS